MQSLRFSHFCRRLAGACAACLLVTAVVIGCSSNKPQKQAVTRYSELPAKKVPPYFKDTIYERTDLFRTEGLVVSGFGLVGRLNDTGNSYAPTAVREYIIKEMVKHGYGSNLIPGMRKFTPELVLADRSFAIVRVDGYLPPGVRKQQTFDVQVSAIPQSETSSLAGGNLFDADLRLNGADPTDPGGSVNVYAKSGGPIFINPEYALAKTSTDPNVRRTLRVGRVMNGGRSMEDRPIGLRLLQPQTSTARQIERRIDQRFQKLADVLKPNNVTGLAEAQDEGVVNFYVPMSFGGDWEHFAKLVSFLYLYESAEFNTQKAMELADAALKPDAPLLEISYCWEGLGPEALAIIRGRDLMTNSSPSVAFAAARAAAFLGDPTAPHVLAQMAQTKDHPYQLTAIQTLAALPNSPAINELIRPLLDSDAALVRQAAYDMLAKNEDNAVFSESVNGKFRLDIARSQAAPLIYATRTGRPRIAIIGNHTTVETPVTFSFMDGRLTISSDASDKYLTLYYRPPMQEHVARYPEPIKVISNPDLAEIVARLGGQGPEGQPALNFNYGEVVAIVNAMTASKKLTALANGTRVPASFMLQELPGVRDSIYAAPSIPESRPQSDHEGPVGETPAGTGPVGMAR